MIDILVPVLGRPQNARPLIESIRASTTVEHRVWFLCSPDDDSQLQAARNTDAEIIMVSTWDPGPADYARKINHGYRATRLVSPTGEWIFTAADDVEFTPGWDTAILKTAERTGAGMVGSNDDANPLVKRGRHSTHSLFSRDYIDNVGGTFFDGPGVVYHEGYKHQWIDTEAVKAAMDRGQWAFARRSLVRHHHPFYDKTARMDSTYEKALGDAPHDSALYKSRLQQWTRQQRATVL